MPRFLSKSLPLMPRRPRFLLWVTMLALVGPFATGCGRSAAGESKPYTMASRNELPADLRDAAVTVRDAYRFAAANPQVLQQLPCYCGCGAMGHGSNHACFVAGKKADGTLLYDGHALGCSICVDIAQDAMRLLAQGQDIAAIRAYVDRTYAKYGPSNMSAPPGWHDQQSGASVSERRVGPT